HGNSLALRIGQLVGNVVARSTSQLKNDADERQRRRNAEQLRLFENFPKGLRLRPGRRYQEAAFRDPEPPAVNTPEKKSARKPSAGRLAPPYGARRSRSGNSRRAMAP